jgi:RNA recognition motif-containing protein
MVLEMTNKNKPHFNNHHHYHHNNSHLMPTAATASAAPSAQQNNPTIIYLGDLSMEVTEHQLREYFKDKLGCPVTQVIKQPHTSYALVQLASEKHAQELLKRAVLQLGGNRYVRIMPYNMPTCFDPNANLIIKNLENWINESHIIAKFAPFGDILSCKLVRDSQSAESKCYAFLQYKLKQSADKAIDELNNTYWDSKYDPDYQYQLFKQRMQQHGLESYQDIDKFQAAQFMAAEQPPLRGKKIYVGVFKPKSEYSKIKQEKEGKPSNLYVTNLGPNVGDRALFDLFKQYGSIKSAKIRRERGTLVDKPLGCGFVDFELPEDAEHARIKLDGSVIVDPVFRTNRTISVRYADCKSRRMKKKLGLLPPNSTAVSTDDEEHEYDNISVSSMSPRPIEHNQKLQHQVTLTNNSNASDELFDIVDSLTAMSMLNNSNSSSNGSGNSRRFSGESQLSDDNSSVGTSGFSSTTDLSKNASLWPIVHQQQQSQMMLLGGFNNISNSNNIGSIITSSFPTFYQRQESQQQQQQQQASEYKLFGGGFNFSKY